MDRRERRRIRSLTLQCGLYAVRASRQRVKTPSCAHTHPHTRGLGAAGAQTLLAAQVATLTQGATAAAAATLGAHDAARAATLERVEALTKGAQLAAAGAAAADAAHAAEMQARVAEQVAALTKGAQVQVLNQRLTDQLRERSPHETQEETLENWRRSVCLTRRAHATGAPVCLC